MFLYIHDFDSLCRPRSQFRLSTNERSHINFMWITESTQEETVLNIYWFQQSIWFGVENSI